MINPKKDQVHQKFLNFKKLKKKLLKQMLKTHKKKVKIMKSIRTALCYRE